VKQSPCFATSTPPNDNHEYLHDYDRMEPKRQCFGLGPIGQWIHEISLFCH